MYLLIIALDNYIYNTKRNILRIDIQRKAKLIVKLGVIGAWESAFDMFVRRTGSS